LVFFCWWLAFSRIRCDIRDTRGGDQAAREQRTEEMDKEMEDTFAARMEEIKALMVEMQERIDLVASKPNRNWGHVGDLGYFREGLKDLLGHNG